MKKTICTLFLIICICAGLCSCDSLNQRPVSLDDNISIPEDGFISSDIFAYLKQENKAVTFTGESKGIQYTWTVFGRDLDDIKDINLGIEIIETKAEKITFRYLSEENFGFSPTLSIYLKELWTAQSALVREILEDGTGAECEATITGGDQSILNFSPDVQTGTFEIVPDIASDTTQPEEIPEESESVSESDSAAPPEQTDPAQTATPAPAPVSTEPDSSAASEPVQTQRPISDGKAAGQDRYKTDPVPAGKPLPAEPENKEVDTRQAYTCTFSIECSTILNNLSDLEPEKLDVLPRNGVIFSAQTVTFYEGESVFDVLQRVCRENNIHMESSWTPMYNSAYIEGIHNLYEFDCGSGSGWMYRVNGWYPNYGCSRYQLSPGDVVEWRYTCDLGSDIGGGYAIDPE